MKTIFGLLALCLILFSCGNENPSVEILEKKILAHPRLLFTEQDEARINGLFGSEPVLDNLRISLLQQADDLLTAPLQIYDLNKGSSETNLLPVSREQVFRMITLSLAYRLSGNKRYAVKVEEELNHVCDFPDWYPAHYLDVAEMTTAVSIAYDWLYDVLSPATKQKIVSSIKTKALDIVIKEYETGNAGSWAKRETNWNVVCNTGMVLGALVTAEQYPELTEQIIQNAVKYIPNCIRHYAPDGVCYEGPGYWGYTNIYLSLLLKALNDNLGQDFGLSAMEGVEQAVLYYIHSVSPSGKVFNFANSGGTSPDTNPTFFYFSRKFNQPEAATFYRDVLSNSLKSAKSPRWFYFLSIPWFDPASFEGITLPKLNVYEGINDIVVFNGDRNIRDYIYLIAKTGDPDMAHQQMDVGTFIVETNGIRWSDDLGSDNYGLPGFWDYKPDGQRWNYFRNSNFSHNTLSIDGKIQYSGGTGEIRSCDDKAEQPFVTFDLSTVYADQAQSVYRTFSMLDDTRMLVTDSVELLSSNQHVRWSMITSADITCNRNTAVLTKDGQSFYLTILSPSGASFGSTPAKTFITPAEYPVEGYSILSTTVTGKTKQVIQIVMSANK